MNTHQRNLIAAVSLCAAIIIPGIASAALVSVLGGQAVNDTDLNITWLANANLAATNTFGVSGINANGTMTWSTAQSWIDAMNAANYLGYQDWRLPTSDDCSGYNCTGSEMGHLFYTELGEVAGSSINTTHNASFNLFNNVQDFYYWSGVNGGGDYRYIFYTGSGFQAVDLKTDHIVALAVRTGQVSTVPVPAAAWLMGSGLVSLIGVARRKTA